MIKYKGWRITTEFDEGEFFYKITSGGVVIESCYGYADGNTKIIDDAKAEIDAEIRIAKRNRK